MDFGLTEWLADAIKGLWADFVEFLSDLFLFALEMVLEVALFVLDVLPLGELIGDLEFQSALTGIPPNALYALHMSGFSTALAMIGTAHGIRILRKVLTLFQW